MIVKSVSYTKKHIDKYPFNTELIKNFKALEFKTPITFIVGENATGKSTFIETLACSLELVTVGNESVKSDPAFKEVRQLAKHFRISKNSFMRTGFFLRSEDFISFTKNQRKVVAELKRDLEEMEKDFEGKSDYAKMLMRGPLVGSIYATENYYNGYLDAKSHGESFLELFHSRLVPNGIYILDEPEVALSPQNQYALMAMILDSVKEGSQFIIATHSPIIEALPNSTIYEVKEGHFNEIEYEDLESVQFYRAFLENPKRYVTYLEE